MHFAAMQYDIAWEDKPANHRLIEAMLDQARLPAGMFVVLPELGDTGFSLSLDLVDDQSLAWGRECARRRRLWLQIGFARRGAEGRGRNCAAIISPGGELVGEYQKVHPFSYGRESEHFRGGDHLLIAECDGVTICPLICYDLRFPELWRLAARAGAEVFTIGANWPATRQHHWTSLIVARAIENQAWVVAANRTGRDPHLEYRGGSLIVAPTGETCEQGGEAAALLRCDADAAAARTWREKFPALRDMHDDLLGSLPIVRVAVQSIAHLQ